MEPYSRLAAIDGLTKTATTALLRSLAPIFRSGARQTASSIYGIGNSIGKTTATIGRTLNNTTSSASRAVEPVLREGFRQAVPYLRSDISGIGSLGRSVYGLGSTLGNTAIAGVNAVAPIVREGFIQAAPQLRNYISGIGKSVYGLGKTLYGTTRDAFGAIRRDPLRFKFSDDLMRYFGNDKIGVRNARRYFEPIFKINDNMRKAFEEAAINARIKRVSAYKLIKQKTREKEQKKLFEKLFNKRNMQNAGDARYL